MDSDQIHTALMGLNNTINWCTNRCIRGKTHENQKAEHDNYKRWVINRQHTIRVGMRGTYTFVGTIAQLAVDWMKSRHLAGEYRGN